MDTEDNNTYEFCSLDDIASFIREHDNYVICGHVNPDGDSIGSMLGLNLILAKLGKHSRCVVDLQGSNNSDTFSFLPGYSSILTESASFYDSDSAHGFATFDHFDLPLDSYTLIAVDVCVGDRLACASSIQQNAKYTLCLDHHKTKSALSNLHFVDADAAACVVLVYQLAKVLNVKIDSDIATCLYAGLLTDTGGFRFQNTTSDVLRIASLLVESGASPSLISNNIFYKRSIVSLKLESCALSNIVIDTKHDYALSYLSASDFECCNASYQDSEFVIDYLRQIEDVSTICLLKEHDNCIRGSLRSKHDFDVRFVAEKFGGGGHKLASGFTIYKPLDEAIALLRDALSNKE